MPEPAVEIEAHYTYDQMLVDIQALTDRYRFLHTEVIGKSVMGRDIPALRIGRGPKEIHYNASHHAREWITTPVLMKFVEDFARAFSAGQKLVGFDVHGIYHAATLWLAPMLNPDGVELSQKGAGHSHPHRDALLRMNKGCRDFRRWKANIRGVDLNLQYRAHWRRARRMGARQPGPAFYPGPAPESEPESRALAEFTRQHDFRMVLAYHSQGEVIFWDYLGLAPEESRSIVTEFGRMSCYRPVANAPFSPNAGYKDWFILNWRRPGFTVEVGTGRAPVPITQFPDIYRRNLPILLYAAEV